MANGGLRRRRQMEVNSIVGAQADRDFSGILSSRVQTWLLSRRASKMHLPSIQWNYTQYGVRST